MLPESKIDMIQSRIFRHLRRSKFQDLNTLLNAAEENNSEKSKLISTLTTNVTSFFRESHHFDLMRAELENRNIGAGDCLRIWSAGCSSGHEPMSIAIELSEIWPDAQDRNIRILATDIDGEVLQRAKRAIFPKSEVDTIANDRKEKFFEKPDDPTSQSVTAKGSIRNLIHFRQLNIHDAWPMKKPFDMVFCRNVVIYFDRKAQSALWPRFHSALKPNGILFIGHSERINPIEGSGFERAGVTAFRRMAR